MEMMFKLFDGRLTLLSHIRGVAVSVSWLKLKKPRTFLEGMPSMKNLLFEATCILQISSPL